MKRRLFEDLVVSQKTANRRSGYALPVSVAAHAALLSAAIVVPLLRANDMPAIANGNTPLPAVPVVMLAATPPPPPVVPIVRPPSSGARRPSGGPPLVAPPPVDYSAVPTENSGVLSEEVETTLARGCVGNCDPSLPPSGPGDGLGPVGPGDGPSAVIHLSQFQGPAKLKDVAPVYPEIARHAGIAGVVAIECQIDTHGRVVNATVLKGSPLLTEAALNAVQQWVYRPTLMNGVPVSVIMTVTVNFKITR
jgi:protein TonB